MSSYSIPSVNAASIAGTAKATVSASPASVASEKAALANRAETVDSIDKGNRSEDSGADGRQTLDTFERKQEDANQNPETETPPTGQTMPLLPDSITRVGTHIDFSA